jgi:hypothetical protein
VVDNIHAGGIASPVDLATSELGRAVGLAPASPFLAHHLERVEARA